MCNQGSAEGEIVGKVMWPMPTLDDKTILTFFKILSNESMSKLSDK